jgi:hypothetical protein
MLLAMQIALVIIWIVTSLSIVQICVWHTDGWEKQKNRFLQFPAGRTPPAQADTRVQFHQDQFRFLVVHETQLAIYEASKLECLKQVGSFSSVLCWLQIIYLSFV